MTAIPELVPLSRVARRLHVSTDRLARLSVVGEFPPIFDVGGALRVREAEVVEE